MPTFTALTGDWKSWIEENLARGCSQESMVDAMVKAHFDPSVAAAHVRNVREAGGEVTVATLPATTANYVHEGIRLPRFCNRVRVGGRDVGVAMRIDQPAVMLFDDLLTGQECDELIRLSQVKLTRSTIVDPLDGRERLIAERSSHGTCFAINETPFIAGIDQRISELLRWPVENGEGLQILHYQVGGEYKTHFDYFPPGDPGSARHLATGGQRVSTLIMYLNDVQQGGETAFPALGLTIVPRKGSALYFEYCNSRNQVDALTLHGGMPVVAGEKWIATKWMRQRRYG